MLVGSASLALGGASLVAGSGAFSTATAARTTTVNVADDESNALVGLDVNSPIQGKKAGERLVTVTNKTASAFTVTVSLDTCADGTLTDSQDNSGCAVQFPLAVGASGTVDIETTVKDQTVPFTVTASGSNFGFSAARETFAQAGNVKNAVKINQVKRFEANAGGQNNWSIQRVHIQDGDNDKDLDRVEYEITDESGTVRATRTDAASGNQFNVKNITIDPDDPSYDLVDGETYTLTVTGYDADENFATETRNATA